MNKIIVWMQSSIDGVTSGPNGEFQRPCRRWDSSWTFRTHARDQHPHNHPHHH
jgi:hypothetical protein